VTPPATSQPAEEPESTPNQHGQTPTDRVVRAASSLAEAAISTVAWGVGTAADLARLATGLAVCASADLAGRAGLALLGSAGTPRDLPEHNRVLVARLHRAALEADLPTTRELVAKDVTWHIPHPEPLAGHYAGVAAAAPALERMWRQLGHVPKVELRDVVASSERAAALLRLSVRNEGRSMTLDRWMILRIDDGRVTEAWGPFAAAPDSSEPIEPVTDETQSDDAQPASGA
jgi:ketosteroid isomerase-like protein